MAHSKYYIHVIVDPASIIVITVVTVIVLDVHLYLLEAGCLH